MSSPSLEVEQALALIAAHPEACDFAGPQPKERIANLESRLGVRLPTDYRAFVTAYGAGSINGFELYGILADDVDSGIPDAGWITLEGRREWDLPE